MSRRQKCSLRALTPEERVQLEQISHAYTVPASHVARAKALLVDGAQHYNVVYPLGGRGLDMAGSMQRILVSRALSGQYPENPEQIMAWLEAVGAAEIKRAYSFRVGWQAYRSAPASLGTTPSLRWFRCRYGSAAFVATGQVVMAIRKPNDPLVTTRDRPSAAASPALQGRVIDG